MSVEHLMGRGVSDQDMATANREELALSPFQLCLVGVCGVLVAGTIGLYIFYPPMDSLIKDMNNIRGSVYDDVRVENSDESIRRIEQWRSRLQKLPTSVLIRFGDVNADQRERMNELLYSLKTLEEYVRTGRYREAESLITYVEKQYMACRKAFRMQQRMQQIVPQAPANP